MHRFLLSALALCLMPTLAAADTLTGTVTYLQRMLLPPDSTLEVVLEDTSLADAPAERIATLTMEDPGAPPYDFKFDYDPATIDPTHSFSLRATIRQGDRLLMTTDTNYPVLTRGAGETADMVLKMVDQDEPQPAVPDAALLETYWKMVTMMGEPVPVIDDMREPHVTLSEDGPRYSATVGCNMMSGAVTLEDDSIAFLPGPTTLMACQPPLDEMEQALQQVLGQATGWKIAGESMWLLDDAGTELAEFQAIYF
ncbi:YbaY family lipoprotein [Tropicimonas sp. IMCC34043]|uniref:YbaY family lipoprotein n=1 Tax=Tropicimonas sp. IMCC34043 TaxID=2248760 RepID=UPI000E281A4D|nr:YbaY family lipoprotein [Tropicimonas sp. IMCC34043]